METTDQPKSRRAQRRARQRAAQQGERRGRAIGWLQGWGDAWGVAKVLIAIALIIWGGSWLYHKVWPDLAITGIERNPAGDFVDANQGNVPKAAFVFYFSTHVKLNTARGEHLELATTYAGYGFSYKVEPGATSYGVAYPQYQEGVPRPGSARLVVVDDVGNIIKSSGSVLFDVPPASVSK